jgi:hypothetical protein
MAATRAKSAPSPNGVIAKPAAKAKQAGESVTQAAGRAKLPIAAAGASAAALASGYMIGRAGGKRGGLLPRRRKVLGVRIGPKTGFERTADILEKLADNLGSVAGQAATTSDDLKKVREEIELLNRRSPIEALLDGLTHRRGAHRREG